MYYAPIRMFLGRVDPEIIVLGMGAGTRLTDVIVVLYLLFTACCN